MTTSVDVTTPTRVNLETSSSPIASTSRDDHEGSTTISTELAIITTATTTTISLSETDSHQLLSRDQCMDLSIITDPDRVQQIKQDKYDR